MMFRLIPGLFAAFYTSSVIFYSKGAYVLGTSKKDDITIAKKYTYVKNGSTNFMVVDTKGRHFKVDNCFYYWNWNKIEDWTNVKPLDQRQIVYYSYRVPFLGMYPTIIEFCKQSDGKQSDEKQSDEKQSDEKQSDEKQLERGEKRSDSKRSDSKRSDSKRSDSKRSDKKQLERGEILKHIHL
jgi:hypothetical protein